MQSLRCGDRLALLVALVDEAHKTSRPSAAVRSRTRAQQSARRARTFLRKRCLRVLDEIERYTKERCEAREEWIIAFDNCVTELRLKFDTVARDAGGEHAAQQRWTAIGAAVPHLPKKALDDRAASASRDPSTLTRKRVFE